MTFNIDKEGNWYLNGNKDKHFTSRCADDGTGIELTSVKENTKFNAFLVNTKTIDFIGDDNANLNLKYFKGGLIKP